MSDYFIRIGDEWRARAADLAQWVMVHMVNRTDVWGRYLAKRYRENEARNHAITAPFREERGKVFLKATSLEKHFKTRSVGGVLGLHSSSSDMTSRWLAIDIDLHDADDLSVSREGNFAAAAYWRNRLVEMKFDPLLFDSNGKGGFHLVVIFAQAMETESVHEFGKRLVEDYEKRGLDRKPEIFPNKPTWNHYGSWLRLFGRHHTRDHYTRVWNDEPWDENQWLEGHEAIDRILSTQIASTEIAEANGVRPARRTVCLDFDGVIHAHRSPWCGAEVIPDEPIHGTREAIAKLREKYRVVVHSARCATEEGFQAVQSWLRTHSIEVDGVYQFKPPASIYVDDRAVPFRGDWLQTARDIDEFRK